jgi:hypothetical protein
MRKRFDITAITWGQELLTAQTFQLGAVYLEMGQIHR